MSKDYYKILQVDPQAEQEVIEAAFKRLARKYHPDTNKSSDATTRMQELNEAYEVLNDAAKRKQYDTRRTVSSYDTAAGEAQKRAREAEAARQKQEQERKEAEERERISKEKAKNAHDIINAKKIRDELERKAKYKKDLVWLMLLSLVGIFVISGFVIYFWPNNNPAPRTAELLTQPLLDDLNGSSLGSAKGISYVNAMDGKGAAFSQKNQSRIEYSGIPDEGTLEWWINVSRGYRYVRHDLNFDNNNALIFTTVGGDVWYPGSTWFTVNSNGTLTLDMTTTKYEGLKQTLIATGTAFRFGEWHSIGISYGSSGQYIMVDGKLVASAPQNTQRLGVGGGHSEANDIPTMGEMVSVFWDDDQFDGGFEGVIDKLRISPVQKNWVLSLEKPLSNK
jgi:curved DNA-binding protein CbpA